jgi:hypothetical protein
MNGPQTRKELFATATATDGDGVATATASARLPCAHQPNPSHPATQWWRHRDGVEMAVHQDLIDLDDYGVIAKA